MLFLRLILKNLWRRPTRTLLTILGISIGIATIVAFGMVTNGLKNSLGGVLKPGKADFSVAKADVADMILSIVTGEQIEVMRKVEGVAEVVPYMLVMTEFGGNPYFIIGGIPPEQVDLLGAKLLDGRVYQNGDEIVVGRIAAKNKKLKVGGTLTLNNKAYSIVGIFESGTSMQDGGVATTIEEVRRIQGVTEDQYSLAMVKVVEGADPRVVADRIEAADPKLIGMVDIEDFNSIDSGLTIVDSVSWAISALAIVIGGIGVMNTIIMSVYERTREIGVLRALGWKRRRVMTMILTEAMCVSVAASVGGALIGLGIVWLAMQTDMGQSFLVITFDGQVFLQAVVVAICVGIFGAAYPSWRAARFSPMEALRYE